MAYSPGGNSTDGGETPQPIEVGSNYVLGQTTSSYGIWTREGNGSPGFLLASFDLTPEAWAIAWNQFNAWEQAARETEGQDGSPVVVPQATSERRSDTSVAPSIAPGSPWKATSQERVRGLTTRVGAASLPRPDEIKTTSLGKKPKKKLQMSALVAALASLGAVADRGLIFVENHKQTGKVLSHSLINGFKYGSYALAVIGFLVGLSARKDILRSDSRRSGLSIAWLGLMIGWVILLVALEQDLWPQIHHAISPG
ncbi:MAG: hypothetical protein HKL80_09810 [Acidimicrobiales bacterium]|nr:hypothetical protein [Acidimicrobiales bacterium]